MKDFSKPFFAIFYTVIFSVFLFVLYWYHTTREEFYYLDGMTNVFVEYYNSYLQFNARIGQFCNLAGRSKFFEQVIGGFICVGFLYTLYLNIFQKNQVIFGRQPKNDHHSRNWCKNSFKKSGREIFLRKILYELGI